MLLFTLALVDVRGAQEKTGRFLRRLTGAVFIALWRARSTGRQASIDGMPSQPTMPTTIRRIEARDEPRWRDLWDRYLRFYEQEPSEAVTRHTWERILDADAPVHAIVAEHEAKGVVGIANYIIHENTWTLTPVCYLEDLFVDPRQRANGVGQQLIDWLVEEMKARGWARLYWHTKENNYRARGLYDKYTPHSGFVRYVLSNPHLEADSRIAAGAGHS